MIPKVSIILANGGIGGVTNTSDGVSGFICTGTGAGILALLTPFVVTSLADAITQGITQAAEPIAYKIVKEFYDVPGTFEVPVYGMLLANTVSLQTMADKTNLNGIMKLVNFSNGTIRVIAISRKPANNYVPTAPQFIDSDAILAGTNALALQQDCLVKKIPLRVLICARVADNTSNVVFVPNTAGQNGVGYVLGDTQLGDDTAIGLILGRVAATDVHVNLGKNLDGALPINMAYIGDRAVKTDLTNAAQDVIDQGELDQFIDKGYITFTSYPQKAGIYISDDPMAVAETDDYRSLANCRVIDKAVIITYQTYIDYLKDDVDTDENDNIAPYVLKSLEGAIVQNINLSMGKSITGDPKVYVALGQAVTATSKLKIKLRVKPKGYLKEIEIELGFQI